MNENMSEEELVQNYPRYLESVRKEDYKEALRLNQLIYENTFLIFNKLLEDRKNALTDEEKLKIESGINNYKDLLEGMVRKSQKIQELNLSKEENESE